MFLKYFVHSARYQAFCAKKKLSFSLAFILIHLVKFHEVLGMSYRKYFFNSPLSAVVRKLTCAYSEFYFIFF